MEIEVYSQLDTTVQTFFPNSGIYLNVILFFINWWRDEPYLCKTRMNLFGVNLKAVVYLNATWLPK